jgi:hypothetical protein
MQRKIVKNNKAFKENNALKNTVLVITVRGVVLKHFSVKTV